MASFSELQEYASVDEGISEFPVYCLTVPESGKDILKPHLSTHHQTNCSQKSYKNLENFELCSFTTSYMKMPAHYQKLGVSV